MNAVISSRLISAHFLALGLSLFFWQSSAQAMNLSLVGGVNRHNPSTNPDPPTGSSLSPQSAFDIGLLADIPIEQGYQFEFGVIRHARKTILEDATSATETSYQGWLIPLTVRFMRADFLGFGFGPYLAFMSAGSGNPNQKGFEMGIRANLRLIFPVWSDLKVLFDGSYLLGFTDMNKINTAEDKNQEFLFLFGLQLPLSSEHPVVETKSRPKPSGEMQR